MTTSNVDTELLSRHPQLLASTMARAKELDELAAKEAEDRDVEAKLVPIVGEAEAAKRTRDRRQQIEQQRAAAEQAIRDAVAKAQADEDKAQRDAEYAERAKARRARKAELLTTMASSIAAFVAAAQKFERAFCQGEDWASFIPAVAKALNENGFHNLPGIDHAFGNTHL